MRGKSIYYRHNHRTPRRGDGLVIWSAIVFVAVMFAIVL